MRWKVFIKCFYTIPNRSLRSAGPHLLRVVGKCQHQQERLHPRPAIAPAVLVPIRRHILLPQLRPMPPIGPVRLPVVLGRVVVAQRRPVPPRVGRVLVGHSCSCHSLGILHK